MSASSMSESKAHAIKRATAVAGQIREIVRDAYEVDIMVPRKEQERARLRMAAMIVMREMGYSYPVIGEVFKRDHSTVFHACHLAEPCAERERIVAEIRRELKRAATPVAAPRARMGA